MCFPIFSLNNFIILMFLIHPRLICKNDTRYKALIFFPSKELSIFWTLCLEEVGHSSPTDASCVQHAISLPIAIPTACLLPSLVPTQD